MRKVVGGAVCAVAMLLSGCGDDDSGGITIQGKDIEFEPDEISAEAGEVSIRFENRGALPHNLVFDEESGIVAGDADVFLEAGVNETYVVTLAVGEYQFYCTVAGHREAGMEGTLTVG